MQNAIYAVVNAALSPHIRGARIEITPHLINQQIAASSPHIRGARIEIFTLSQFLYNRTRRLTYVGRGLKSKYINLLNAAVESPHIRGARIEISERLHLLR